MQIFDAENDLGEIAAYFQGREYDCGLTSDFGENIDQQYNHHGQRTDDNLGADDEIW